MCNVFKCKMTITLWKMFRCWCSVLVFFISLKLITAFNYDYASSCARPYRSARSNSILAGIPCDLNKQSYCNQPGAAYPWHAVRRFVHENQGLMRRMYGEQRHISVLKSEMDNNEIDGGILDFDKVKDRHKSKDEAIIKTKQLYSKKPTARANDLKTVPHFRPAHTTPKAHKPTAESLDKMKDKIEQVKEIVKKIETINKSHSSGDRDVTKTSIIDGIVQNESDNIEKVASYKTTFLQEELHEDTVEHKENTNLHHNIIEPEIITLEEMLKQTLEAGSVQLNQSQVDVNVTAIPPKHFTNTTLDTTQKSSTAAPASNNLLLSEIEMEEEIEVPEEISTESSEEAGWKPMTVDPSTLPPTLLFSEHDKHKHDRVEPVVMDSSDKPLETSSDQTSSHQSTTHTDQEPTRPVIKLKGVNACPVKEEVVAPFWANNTRGEILALLNLYPFEQYVHWEKCTHEHKQMYCREGCRCEQQYRLHRLLAYDPSNECRGIFSDWFRFPSCCVCKCFDVPLEYRVTSRSPRILEPEYDEDVKQAIYDDAASDWYTIDLEG